MTQSTIEPITSRQLLEADGVQDWRKVAGGACAYFRTGSFAATAHFVQAISELADLEDHQPDLDVRPGGVHVWLNTVTDAYYGLTARDLELARQISTVARELDVPADPSAVQSLVIPIDAMAIPDVLPFWRAVLGYDTRADTPDVELNDPHNRWPIVCFGQMDAPRPQRNRIHVDVWVPPDRAEARVAAAIAAGGHLVTDEYAPRWWVLADAEGNEACVTTWLSGDESGLLDPES